MVSEATYRKAVKIFFLCIIWYTVSSINNVVTKLILNDFPYPMTVTMVHLVSTTLYSMPVMIIWDIPSSARVPLRLWFKLILPLALGKVFASVSSHVSIWKVPVSYAHTVKATMPLFTVILSWLIIGEKITFKIFMSLVPIVGGVAIATVTELSFNIIGLVSALSATLGFALQNILSKKCLRETGIHHLRLLYVLAMMAALCMLPIWAFRDLRMLLVDSTVFQTIHAPKLTALLFIESLCGFLQNLVAFTVIALVTPLSYAVANASKRISIITVSLIFLRNPVSPMNVFGMSLAVVGVLAYNKTKLDQRRAMDSLPTTVKAASQFTNGHISNKSNGISLHNNPNSPFMKNHVFFGDEQSYPNGSHVAHPMTPPAQHTNVSRTKYEDREGNTIWVNV